jgi:PPOX class probable F420-dependent enzyme
MPNAPVSPEVDAFLKEARPAVMATVGPTGKPLTVPCWYDWQDGRLLLNMHKAAKRLEHLRANPNVAITMLGDPWYTQVSVVGHVSEIREDPDQVDCDALSYRYRGEPFTSYRGKSLMTVMVDVDRYSTYGFEE